MIASSARMFYGLRSFKVEITDAHGRVIDTIETDNAEAYCRAYNEVIDHQQARPARR